MFAHELLSHPNTSIDLREYASFCSYQSIQERGTDLINLLIDDCLPMPQVEISKIQTAAHRKSEAGLPKMDQLIEFGLIHPGDQVYITVKPTESVATLLDAKYVDYKGNKITLNDWGCQVTGRSAIRIYSYVAVVGETETLHQKRLAYVNEHNEP